MVSQTDCSEDSTTATDGSVNTSNDDNMIVLDSEEEQDGNVMIVLDCGEEPSENNENSMELNPVAEIETDNEQCISIVAYHNEEGDVIGREPGGSISTTLESCNQLQPAIYSESDIQCVISCGDFGRVVQMQSQVNLTDHQKYSLLKKHFPITNFPLV